ncbi:MAG: hypothetical protein GF372_13645 [Candidatus Marinimicrobia bacterium]|nr:hypothetical protein [Candidatus Neomarinimicrobiota bacterium]
MQGADEIEVMRDINRLLNNLESSQRSRIVRWLYDKYVVENESASLPSKADDNAQSMSGETQLDLQKGQEPKHRNFADFFAAVNPQTDSERALISSYWLQVKEGKEHVRAYDVNALLKDLGHPINNITRAFDHLQSKSPQLIMQVRKKGRSQQARKRYRVTQAGIDKITEMLQTQ